MTFRLKLVMVLGSIAIAGVVLAQPSKSASPIFTERIFVHTSASFYLTGDYLWFKIYCVDASDNRPSGLSKIAYVELLDINNKPHLQAKTTLVNGMGAGEIFIPTSIASGNYVLRVYTRWMRNFAPETYFHRQLSIVNPFISLPPLDRRQAGTVRLTEPGAVEGDQKETLVIRSRQQNTYTTRSLVDIELLVTDDVGNPAVANLSLSAYRLDSLQRPDDMAIARGLSASRMQGGNAKPVVVRYIPEDKFHIVEAAVVNNDTNDSAKLMMTYLTVPGTKFKFQAARTENKGTARFELKDFYGSNRILLQTDYRTDSSYNVRLIDSFSREYASSNSGNLTLSQRMAQQLVDRSRNLQLRNLFFRSKSNASEQPDKDSLQFYNIPDEKYFLDKFTRFPTVEDVMREYVPGIFVRKQNNSFHFYAIDKDRKATFRNEPLILLDGFPVFVTDDIIKYDPLNIKKLEVVTRRYFLGTATFSGIVSYSTYKGDMKALNLRKNVSQYSYEGIQRAGKFRAPVYSTDDEIRSRLPDFRDQLHWDPELITDDDGRCHVRFYTSDQTGRYCVSINGLSQTGGAGSHSFVIEVTERRDP